jgi:ribosomal protein S18 acetylase RimI-like enzyme
MIKKLHNHKLETSTQIHTVFQLSYKVEAELLGAKEFPPLKRTTESYLDSHNDFYGYFENDELAGIIEIELTDQHIDINSLVVVPKFFRRGIGRKLLEFVINTYESSHFMVETGVENTPATALYKKMGFREIKQWDTDFGVRKIRFEKINK